jgi:hypothetical protein
VVIDAMDEYQNIDQHQVDKVEQVADVAHTARQQARSRDAALPHGGQEYAVIAPRHRRRMR